MAIKEVHENALLTFFEALPVLLADLLIGTVIRVLILDIGLLGDLVQVLMKSFKEETEHLLGVVLCEALKLSGSPSDDLFDLPRCHIFAIASVKLLDELRKRHGQAPTCT